MERLTGYTGCRYEAYDPIDTKYDFSETNLQKLIDKLAYYEDLEEKCIKENSFSLRALLEKWNAFCDDIAQWLEWRNLKESGRLIVLPCKVGEIVYKLLEYSCYRFIIKKKHFYYNDIPDFGKTVFLTCEEAEAALKGGGVDEEI